MVRLDLKIFQPKPFQCAECLGVSPWVSLVADDGVPGRLHLSLQEAQTTTAPASVK